MRAQKIVLMHALSVVGMVSAVAVTADGAVATVVKAVTSKAAWTVVLKIVTTAEVTVGVASAGNAALKHALKMHHVRSARNAQQTRCVVKRRVMTAGQIRPAVVMGSNAATAALKTASPALTVCAVSVPAVSEASAQNAGTVRRHAMLQSRTLRWLIKPLWQQPYVSVMTPSLCKIALPWTPDAMKAAVSAVSAMVVAMTVVVNAAKRATQTLKKRVHPALK